MKTASDKPMKTTSGFTEDINKEMNVAEPQPVESKFSNLSQCYVSISGHTRIFTATRYGKRYMLKCLKNDFLYTPIYRQALTKEFEIGLQLEHPNICHTIGMEEVENLGTTIVMEYIDGDTLQYLIDQQLLTAEMAHKIAHELMDALVVFYLRLLLRSGRIAIPAFLYILCILCIIASCFRHYPKRGHSARFGFAGGRDHPAYPFLQIWRDGGNATHFKSHQPFR
jgi:serine/threonine protein kinase